MLSIKLNREEIEIYPVKIDLNQPIHYVYDSTCQLLNNLLETQDSQLEMSRNPPLFGDVLSAEEHVLGCMCDSFRSSLGQNKGNKFSSINVSTSEWDKMEGRKGRSLLKKDILYPSSVLEFMVSIGANPIISILN